MQPIEPRGQQFEPGEVLIRSQPARRLPVALDVGIVDLCQQPPRSGIAVGQRVAVELEDHADAGLLRLVGNAPGVGDDARPIGGRGVTACLRPGPDADARCA